MKSNPLSDTRGRVALVKRLIMFHSYEADFHCPAARSCPCR